MNDVSDGCLATGEGTPEKISEFHPSGVTEVVGSIPTWNYEIFSIVPPPVAKQPSITSFIRGCIERHCIFHVSPFLLLCAFLNIRGGTILMITVHWGFNVVAKNL